MKIYSCSFKILSYNQVQSSTIKSLLTDEKELTKVSCRHPFNV